MLLDEVWPDVMEDVAEMNMFRRQHGEGVLDILVETAHQTAQLALQIEPDVRQCGRCEADHAFTGESPFGGFCLDIMGRDPGTEHPLDLALEHRWRCAEPDRIDQHENCRIVDDIELIGHVLALAEARGWALGPFQDRLEPHCIKVSDDRPVAALTNGVTIGVRD
jgi:hypothetical protein